MVNEQNTFTMNPNGKSWSYLVLFTAFSFEISMGTSEITPFLDTASPCYFFFNHPISPPLAPGEHCVSHGQQPSQWISPCGPGNFTTQLLGFGGVFPPEPAESRWDMVGWSWMDGSTWVSWCWLKLPNHFSGAVFACNFGRKCLMELCYQLFRIDQLRMDPWRVVMCRTRRLVLVVGPSRCVLPRNAKKFPAHISTYFFRDLRYWRLLLPVHCTSAARVDPHPSLYHLSSINHLRLVYVQHRQQRLYHLISSRHISYQVN